MKNNTIYRKGGYKTFNIFPGTEDMLCLYPFMIHYTTVFPYAAPPPAINSGKNMNIRYDIRKQPQITVSYSNSRL